MKRRLTAIAVLAMALLGSACGSDSAAKTSNDDDGGSSTAARAVPDGCPSARDFGVALWGEEEASTFTEIGGDSLSQYLKVALPPGGCAYASKRIQQDSSSSEQYQRITVAYFNLGAPGHLSVSEMQDWAQSAGANLSDPNLSLPTSFSGFPTSSVYLTTGDEEMFGSEPIPEYTDGDSAQVDFALSRLQVAALLAAPSQDSSGDQAISVDPVDAMAQGIPAPFDGSFEYKDAQGYTARVRVKGNLDPFTAQVENSPPGQFSAVTSAALHATATNTTAGRNTPVPPMHLIAVYPLQGPAGCAGTELSKAGDDWLDPSFCVIPLGHVGESELAPDQQSELPVTEVPIEITGLSEGGGALKELNAPLGLYVWMGNDPIHTAAAAITSTSGCEAAGEGFTAWYVPMTGWPDPVCG